jgi:hypothetical protein
VDDPDGVQGTVIRRLTTKKQLVGFCTDIAGEACRVDCFAAHSLALQKHGGPGD